MRTCGAPHRLPDGYYERLMTMTPEQGAVTFVAEVLADDHDCGDPAVGTIQYRVVTRFRSANTNAATSKIALRR